MKNCASSSAVVVDVVTKSVEDFKASVCETAVKVVISVVVLVVLVVATVVVGTSKRQLGSRYPGLQSHFLDVKLHFPWP